MTAAALHAHLGSGITHVCQCWSIRRRDGVTLGFTDHDRDLQFDDITFQVDSGMAAKALAGTTGLSVNNTEAVGLLRSDLMREQDIAAGRFDGAEVVNWLVRWDDVTARQVRFRGTLGEMTRRGGAFEVELRGLSEALNVPQGRAYLRTCSAVLGDRACGVNLDDPAFHHVGKIGAVAQDQSLAVTVTQDYPDRWFEDGVLRVETGDAAGLTAAIKTDWRMPDRREVMLWDGLKVALAPGDRVRLTAGCDRRAETCRLRFDNLLNFRGFPDMPGDDWQATVPRQSQPTTGGSLVR